MPASFQHLRVRLRIEQTRLLNWGQEIGLVEELLNEPNRLLEQNRNLALDILLEIQNIFKTCINAEIKTDRLVTQRRMGTPIADTIDKTNFGQRFPQVTNSFLQKTLKVLDKASNIPERVLWSMVRKDKFENLVHKLIDYNSSIEALLDRTSIIQLQYMQQQTFMALLQLNSSVSELKEVSRALQVKAGAKSPTASDLGKQAGALENFDSGVDIARLADFKAQQIQVENQSSEILQIDPLDPKDITFSNVADTRSVAEYQNRAVWIEWKYSNIDMGLHPQWKALLEYRIKKLVLLLKPPNKPPEFNAPQCLGYFYEDPEERFGFVFSTPSYAALNATPSSLLEIIKAHWTNGDNKARHSLPSLAKRIQLAHLIARSLMYIHSVNWIHKGLRSDNIIFFLPQQQQQHPHPDNINNSGYHGDDGSSDQQLDPGRRNSPYLDLDLRHAPLISGFEYARPDMPEEETEPPPENSEWDVYRHPQQRRRAARSQKSGDIYSLGIVLVEIAYWKPIQEILKLPSVTGGESEGGPRTTRATRDVRQVLLHRAHLAVMAGLLGEAYTAVVKTCLTGGEALGIPDHTSENNVQIGARLQETFVREVVDKLDSIKV